MHTVHCSGQLSLGYLRRFTSVCSHDANHGDSANNPDQFVLEYGARELLSYHQVHVILDVATGFLLLAKGQCAEKVEELPYLLRDILSR